MFIEPIKPIESLSQPVNGQDALPPSSLPFQNILRDALAGLETATEQAAQDGYDLVLGDADDLALLQINAMKAESMLQTTVQLTTRIVNAYKEIMQMQI